MDNDLTIKQAREAAAHPPGPRPPARAAGAVPRVILGDWLCWVLSGMWGGREWWDPPAAAARVRGEGSAEMRPGARKAAGGDGYPSRMNWGGWGALWGARGGGGGLFSCFDCRLTRFFTFWEHSPIHARKRGFRRKSWEFWGSWPYFSVDWAGG